MDYLRIEGGNRLNGSIDISGAKNSALPVIASTILSDRDVHIKNIPNVVDIRTLLKLITMLGGEVEQSETEVKIHK